MANSQQTPTKLFIQMSGAPGSGKSTVARLLRPRINGVVIDHDILRSSFLHSGLIPFDEAAKQAYSLQWTLAQDIMEQGFSVIVDSTCNYQETLDRGSALASKHGYTYWYVECKVTIIDILDSRLRSRHSRASQRVAVDSLPIAAQATRVDEDARARFMNWIDNPCRPDSNAVVVDATGRPEMVRDEILKEIGIQ